MKLAKSPLTVDINRFRATTPQLTIGRIMVVLMMWDYGYLKMCQNKPKNKGIFLNTPLKPSNFKGFQG